MNMMEAVSFQKGDEASGDSVAMPQIQPTDTSQPVSHTQPVPHDAPASGRGDTRISLLDTPSGTAHHFTKRGKDVFYSARVRHLLSNEMETVSAWAQSWISEFELNLQLQLNFNLKVKLKLVLN